jgi:hypothetical protein
MPTDTDTDLGFVPVDAPDDLGFVEQPSRETYIQNQTPTTFMSKVNAFFRNPDMEQARAMNVYALSKQTGISLKDASENYDVLRKTSKITGLTPEADAMEFLGVAMIPAIAAGAVANFPVTAAALTAFYALDKAIPTKEWIESYEKSQGFEIKDEFTKTIELVDFIGKGAIAGGIATRGVKSAGKLINSWMEQKISEYKLPVNMAVLTKMEEVTGVKPSLEPTADILPKDNLARDAQGNLISVNLPPDSPLNFATAEEYVASKGTPLFHGTKDKSVTSLKASKPKNAPGNMEGVYLTPDKTYAEANGDNIIEAYANLKNPFRGDPNEYYAKENGISVPSFGSKPEVFEKYKQVNPENVKKFLKDKGYDGVIRNTYQGDEVIVFDESAIQTKSQLTAEFNAAKANASLGENKLGQSELLGEQKQISSSQSQSASVPKSPEELGLSQLSGERITKSGLEPEGTSQISGSGKETSLPQSEPLLQPKRQEISQMSSQEVSPSPSTLAPEIDPVKKVIEALKEAKPVRAKQETLYSKERARRMAIALSSRGKMKGEKGFYKELGALKGELPKAEFEAIREKLKQEDIDALFNMITDSPKLSFWESVTARTALGKLFGEYGGTVPQKGELALLNKVFGNELTETLISKMPMWDKFKEGASQVLNIPRSIMSSFDLSAPLRQGVFFVGRKEFYPAFGEMFKLFASEKNLAALQDNISRRPTFELMKESKLALTDMNVMLEAREEAFMSNLAEKIPVIGKGIRASGRAYVGFLNKLRADVFDSMVRDAERLGLNVMENKDLLKQIASFINTATGRGELGALSGASVALNNIFFSPRLIASRLSLMNPLYYARLNPYVRAEALKSLLTFSSVIGTILALAKLSGVEVGTDWRSSDFLKIKVNRTRIDILGGFQQYMRMFGQLWTGKYVSSVTGKVVTLGEGYKPLTRKDILQRQIESKLSPVASFIAALLEQQTWDGKKVKVTDEIRNRLTPMVFNDLMTVIKDDPSLIPLEGLGLFGVGIQTYSKPEKKVKF